MTCKGMPGLRRWQRSLPKERQRRGRREARRFGGIVKLSRLCRSLLPQRLPRTRASSPQTNPRPQDWLQCVCSELSTVASHFGAWSGDFDHVWIDVVVDGDIEDAVLSWGATARCRVSETLRGEIDGHSWRRATRVVLSGSLEVSARRSLWESERSQSSRSQAFSATGVYARGSVAWIAAHDFFGLRRLGNAVRPVPEAFRSTFDRRPFLSVRLTTD